MASDQLRTRLPRDFGPAGSRPSARRVDADGVDADYLKDRVSIERKVTEQNDLGESVESWQVWQQVWAGVEQTRGGEVVQAGQVHALTTHLVTIRHIGGLNTAMRIRLETGQILNIADAENPGQRNVCWLLTCIEDRRG